MCTYFSQIIFPNNSSYFNGSMMLPIVSSLEFFSSSEFIYLNIILKCLVALVFINEQNRHGFSPCETWSGF